ncbi:MAG: hypothetical protein ABIP13_00150 [Tepidiformaceae bacterium]
MPEVTPRLEFHATSAVEAAISALGRSEDLRFSPGNGLLAIAGTKRARCLVLRINIEDGPAGPRVSAADFLTLGSPALRYPHGLDFIDDETLVFANRQGKFISVLKIPEGELGGRHYEVEAASKIRGSLFARVKTPGSVAARHESTGLVTLLVCNNYAHKVTQHLVDPKASYRHLESSHLFSRGLKVPDGISLSADGTWIAISSHNTHTVNLFETSAGKGRRVEASGTLSGVDCPHGVRFSNDVEHILVADAAAPLIHVYRRESGWRGNHEVSRSAVVLDEETFLRGRHNPEEGGPKGIDIDRSARVVAITCEEEPLAFFAFRDIIGESPPPS